MRRTFSASYSIRHFTGVGMLVHYKTSTKKVVHGEIVFFTLVFLDLIKYSFAGRADLFGMNFLRVLSMLF